jgi:hypothetical protein
MADFALWATACETALWPAGTFTGAYAAVARAAMKAVATSIREFMAPAARGPAQRGAPAGVTVIAAAGAERRRIDVVGGLEL